MRHAVLKFLVKQTSSIHNLENSQYAPLVPHADFFKKLLVTDFSNGEPPALVNHADHFTKWFCTRACLLGIIHKKRISHFTFRPGHAADQATLFTERNGM